MKGKKSTPRRAISPNEFWWRTLASGDVCQNCARTWRASSTPPAISYCPHNSVAFGKNASGQSVVTECSQSQYRRFGAAASLPERADAVLKPGRVDGRREYLLPNLTVYLGPVVNSLWRSAMPTPKGRPQGSTTTRDRDRHIAYEVVRLTNRGIRPGLVEAAVADRYKISARQVRAAVKAHRAEAMTRADGYLAELKRLGKITGS